jgi:hypothetical protein
MSFDAQQAATHEKPVEEKSAEISQSKEFTVDDVEKIKRENEELAKRLANKDIEHSRKTEGLKKRIEELEKKEKAGTATHEESMELSAGRQAASEASKNNLSPQEVEFVVQDRMKKKEFSENLKKAEDSDPAFKAMLNDPKNQGKFNDDHAYAMRDLPNAPAVIKKLLSDPREMALMQAKYQDALTMGSSSMFVEYMNKLSEKIEQSTSRPRASSYTPAPDISDFGDSSQDFDLGNYVSSHR